MTLKFKVKVTLTSFLLMTLHHALLHIQCTNNIWWLWDFRQKCSETDIRTDEGQLNKKFDPSWYNLYLIITLVSSITYFIIPWGSCLVTSVWRLMETLGMMSSLSVTLFFLASINWLSIVIVGYINKSLTFKSISNICRRVIINSVASKEWLKNIIKMTRIFIAVFPLSYF